jgi:hypothetical protein
MAISARVPYLLIMATVVVLMNKRSGKGNNTDRETRGSTSMAIELSSRYRVSQVVVVRMRAPPSLELPSAELLCSKSYLDLHPDLLQTAIRSRKLWQRRISAAVARHG